MKGNWFLSVYILLFPLAVAGQEGAFNRFQNIYPENGPMAVTCFMQDPQGLIWFGTDKGLYSYDGYSAKAHYKFDEPGNTRINCGVIVDSSLMYLGTDNGILLFNSRTDRYESVPALFPSDIRAMALQGDYLWIGTLNGLYRYEMAKKHLKRFDKKDYPALPSQTIYSIIKTRENEIYIGTYKGLCRYSAKKDAFQSVDLPVRMRNNNLFVNSLLEDTLRHCLWIGTEGDLLSYSLRDGKTESFSIFQPNSIKYLALDAEKRLLIATDDGLFTYKESERSQHIVHDARSGNSLANNNIWHIFVDRDLNVWLGTDNGIHLFHTGGMCRKFPSPS
jgi:ligand-binding sensor domain-containing protein